MSDETIDIAPDSTHPRWKHVWSYAWMGCFTLIAWLTLLMLPWAPITPELDPSWNAALSYFANRGLHFGTDVIFTFGPLGHFASYTYSGYLPTSQIIWEFTIKGLAAILFCYALRELHLVIRISLAVCIILFLGNFEEAYSFTIVVAGLMLLRSEKQNIFLTALLGLFLAAISLVKFTYFLEGTCAIGCATAYYLVYRRWTFLVLLISSYCVGFFGCWFLAKQNIGNLFPYLGNSLQITTGYNAAMLRPTSSSAVIWIAVLLATLFLFQLILFWSQTDDKARLISGSIFLLLILFFTWKHAFTRWDNHAYKFFAIFLELLFASWLLNTTGNLNRKSLTVTSVAAAVGLLGIMIVQEESFIPTFLRLRGQYRFTYSVLTDYKTFDSQRRERLREARDAFALPRIATAVGDRSVDVLGYRQGIALLNRLNYAPRPVFQGYSAYTPSLIEQNTEHYRSNARPDFVISKLETIDDRFPTLDDSKVLLELLYNYRPTVNEKGWQLWEAARSHEIITPRLVATTTAKLGQTVQIPESDPLWVELEIKQTDRGRFRSFFYKSAPIMIELEDDAGHSFRYRVIPSMTTSGFLLNPEVTTDDQLLLAARGDALPRYRSLKLTEESGGGLFKKNFTIRFSGLPGLGTL